MGTWQYGTMDIQNAQNACGNACIYCILSSVAPFIWVTGDLYGGHRSVRETTIPFEYTVSVWKCFNLYSFAGMVSFVFFSSALHHGGDFSRLFSDFTNIFFEKISALQ